MSEYYFCKLGTKIGDFSMLIDNQDIVVASGFTSPKELQSRLPKSYKEAAFSESPGHRYLQHLSDYFNGNYTSLEQIRYSQDGGEFCKNIWSEMSKIPAGATLTYKQLAKKAGNENAVRAAGSACAKNLITLIIPCHRVTKSDGSLGQYAYGAKIKEYLINHESNQ